MLRKEKNDDCMVAMEWQPDRKRIQARELDQLGRSQAGAQRKTELFGERKLQPSLRGRR